MINHKSVLAIVPARGGSKRLPGKNTIDFLGKPLICWTVDSAIKSKYIDKTIISTDSQNIADICNKNGIEVPYLRPKELALDDSETIDVILHVIQNTEKEFDIIIVLQPTSPLRQASDIDSALEFMDKNQSSSCVSISKTTKPIHWSYIKYEKHKIKPVFDDNHPMVRDNQYKNIFTPNGALYIIKTKWLIEKRTFFNSGTIGYEMSQFKSIDIDTDFDLKIARAIGEQVLNDN